METIEQSAAIRRTRGPLAAALNLVVLASLLAVVPVVEASAADMGALAGMSAVSAGNSHTCALTTAGGVKCWGWNFYGQLGDGTTTDSATPVNVAGLSKGIVAVSAGGFHTCAVTTAGGVKCWGNNDYGQLGTGNASSSLTPVAIPGLSSVVAISGSSDHTCVVTSTGAAKCWGYNNYGQLGNNTQVNQNSPVPVLGLSSGVTAISANSQQTCAVLANGTVKCWGHNDNGQLGDLTAVNRLTPVIASVLGSAQAVAVSTGQSHTCAVTALGAAKCWGLNSYGQLGGGSSTDLFAYVTPSGLSSGVSSITANVRYTCALTTAGAAKCWGNNDFGKLGDGTDFDRYSPVDVVGLASGVAGISAGSDHVCAAISTGGIRCWGSNQFGELGNDAAVTTVKSPSGVSGLSSGVTHVSVGYQHACAVVASGAKCWGDNEYGQLGNGSQASTFIPAGVSDLSTGVASVSAGGGHSCALTTSGGVKCWGADGYGQLGDGQVHALSLSTQPVDVVGLTSGVTAVSAGFGYTCALISGGVKCWGDNNYGQLGDGTTEAADQPVAVSGLSTGVTAISAGGAVTCALQSGGVKCWGYNEDGELGDGTTVSSLIPVAVSTLSSGVTAISVGGLHVCALITDGSVKCWGYNGEGQLGDGTTDSTSQPVAVSGLSTGVTAISAGSNNTCALITGGSVKCWGYNGDGQLGNGTVVDSLTPVDVSGLSSGVTFLSARYSDSCVLIGGALQCWGNNADGQAGVNPGWAPIDVLEGSVARYTLSVSKSGAGTGKVTSSIPNIRCGTTCLAVYDTGTVVVLTATPSAASIFTGWSGGGCSGTGTCTVTMTQARTVTAAFAPAPYRPDALISRYSTGPFRGDDVYNTTGDNQELTPTIQRGTSKSFYAKFENDGTQSDSYLLIGTASGGAFTVRYYKGTTDITAAVVAGTYSTSSLASGGTVKVRIVVTASSGALTGAKRSVFLTATSKKSTSKKDAIRLDAKV